MTARDRDHYVKAWQEHVKQLAGLYLAASAPGTFEADREAYERMRAELFAVIERAADNQKWEAK